QFFVANKIHTMFIVFQRSKYIINNVRLMPGTYYLTAIIIECAPG
ncbi:hypothetical protein GRV44_004792, partial [Salmonella enterica subsp. enterica serovar Typhimurium]|nr:hypothetical protein [Salmonella enterica subsp. enterica serovar Typhimurium]EEJ7670123.1 hypothetical protein [Salmonella enterica]